MPYRTSDLARCELCAASIAKSDTYLDTQGRLLCRVCHARDDQARMDDFRQGTPMDRKFAAANDGAAGTFRWIRLCLMGIGLLFMLARACK